MSAWKEYKEKLGDSRPWHMLDTSNYTDEKTSNSRYLICLSCPSLIKLTKVCNECVCFMKEKTKLETAVCPLGKW